MRLIKDLGQRDKTWHRVCFGRQVGQVQASGEEVDICCGWRQQAQASGPGSGAAVRSVPSFDAWRNTILMSNSSPTLLVPLAPDDTQAKEVNGPACCSQLPGHIGNGWASFFFSSPHSPGSGDALSRKLGDSLEALLDLGH